jgi:hypothetical protein
MTNILEVLWEDIAVDSFGFDCGCLLQRESGACSRAPRAMTPKCIGR